MGERVGEKSTWDASVALAMEMIEILNTPETKQEIEPRWVALAWGYLVELEGLKMVEAGRDFVKVHAVENRIHVAELFHQLRSCDMRTEEGRRKWYGVAQRIVRRQSNAWMELIDEASRRVRRGSLLAEGKRRREEEEESMENMTCLEDVLQNVRRKLPVEDMLEVKPLQAVARRPDILGDSVVEEELKREMARMEKADKGITWLVLNWGEVAEIFGEKTQQEFKSEHELALKYVRAVRQAVARANGRRWGKAKGVNVTDSLSYERIGFSLRDKK
jgi:hypothetical protein